MPPKALGTNGLTDSVNGNATSEDDNFTNDTSYYLIPPAIVTTSPNSKTSTVLYDLNMPPKANISVRDYFYPIPHYPLPPNTPVPYSTGLPTSNPLNLSPHAFEPTSTLVLTSPSSTFLDIRVLKPIVPGEAELPNTGGPQRRLDWAFGGKSASSAISNAIPSNSVTDDDGNAIIPTHSVWTHWVDSKYSVGDPKTPADEGNMYALPDGRVLEHGHSFNPLLGRESSYEEMWSDVDIEACRPSASKVSLVLRIQNDRFDIRGLIVRVGQFVQGMLRQGELVTVERWEFSDEVDRAGNVVGRDWKRTVRVGDLFVPCAVAFKDEDLQVGTKVKFTDYHWFVEELVRWTD